MVQSQQAECTEDCFGVSPVGFEYQGTQLSAGFANLQGLLMSDSLLVFVGSNRKTTVQLKTFKVLIQDYLETTFAL